MIQRRLLLKGSLSVAAATGFPAFAQNAPGRILIGFPSGGSTDLVARGVAEQLRARTDRSWIVDSRPGAGGRLAISLFKDLSSDGSNLLITPSPMVTMYPHTYRTLAYDPMTDLVPASSTVRFAYVLVAGPGLPASVQNVAQLKAWAAGKRAAYGTPGAGSGVHMAGVILSKALNVDLMHVPYKGGAPMIVDVLGGQIPLGFTVLSDVMPHVESGKLRVLGVTGTQRSPQLRGAMTFQEQGVADLDFLDWQGAFLPRRASRADAEVMNGWLVESLKAPDFVQLATKNGLQPGGESRAEFARLVRDDLQRWKPIVKASGFTAED